VTQQLLTMSYITNEALVVLENELVIANRVERQYSNEFAQTGAKVGNTVNIRRPPRYIGTYGPPLNVEDTFETYTPVVLNYQFHVDVQFTTQDLALSMDMFKKRILKPQIATVANRIDADSAQYYTLNTATSLGTAGIQPSSYKIFSDSRALLALEACPTEGEKNCVLDPITMSAATDSIKGLFNPQAKIGGYNEKGMVAKEFAGLDWWEDQNIYSFTTGTNTGTASAFTLYNTAGTGSLLTSGWAASGTLGVQGFTASSAVCTVGDVFTIAGVYPVNPQNRRQYGRSLKQFVVLPPGGFGTPPNGAATTGIYYSPASLTNGTFNNLTGVYTSDTNGYCSLLVADAVISGGQFQNVTAAPAATAAIVFNNGATQGTVSPQGLVFHKYAYALAFADLPLPQGVEMAARAYDDEDVGMSIRMVTQYTINNDSEPTRADVLYGPASLYRQLAIRVCG
jgi:P22 coat protein - gene protein 5